MAIIKCSVLVLVMNCCIFCQAQNTDTTFIKDDSFSVAPGALQIAVKKGSFSKSLIVPVAMIAYGAITLKSSPLKSFDNDVQQRIWVDNPHAKCHLDNYLQYAPVVAVYGLNLAGVRGKNNFRDRTIILFMSTLFLNITVSSVKNWAHELRPDGTDYLSFPSGHTAEAFASAEFLRQEYRDVSPWYGIAGYATATVTGLLRMYNNRHWLNDVIGGAGIGIASTKLAYWLYPKISRKLFHQKTGPATIMPYYQHNGAGLCMLYIFR